MKILSLIILLLFLYSCQDEREDRAGAPSLPPNQDEVPIKFPVDISFNGHGNMGFFDPSLAYEPQTGKLWMSYSAVNPASHTPDEYSVYIRLASSSDGGKTWSDEGSLNDSTEHMLGEIQLAIGNTVIPAGTPGTWMSETSELHYDELAPIHERWKLIYMNYLRIDPDLGSVNDSTSMHVGLGWMAMKTAATPLELAKAPAKKLMSNFGYDQVANTTGFPDFSPIAGPPLIQPVIDFAQDDPLGDLSSCVFSEPTLHTNNDAIYLLMGCHAVLLNNRVPNQVLFKCERPCDMSKASSWQYLGKLISPQDAGAIDPSYLGYNGSDFIVYQNELYLVSTPVAPVYSGCHVFKVADIDSLSLEKEGGKLKIYQEYKGENSAIHNGACGYHEEAHEWGLFHSQLENFTYPLHFQIHASGFAPIAQ